LKKIRLSYYTVWINIVGVLALVGSVVIMPIAAYQLYHVFNFSDTDIDVETRPRLSNYLPYDWAEKFFEEYFLLSTQYYDYVVWRHLPTHGETININLLGDRETVLSSNIQNDHKIYHFFGGSSMWGVGVNDENTIPSIFSKKHNVITINNGELSYISRQSIAKMISKYATMKMDKNKGNTIIFYDGANDVSVGCRSEVTGVSSVREKQIQSFVSKNSYKTGESPVLSWQHIISPIIIFVNKFVGKLGVNNSESFYSCAKNKERAKEVAKSLVEVWRMASAIAHKNGDKFFAILQPVSYIGKPNLDHLTSSKKAGINFDPKVKKEFLAVYPLIRQFANEEKDLKFIDLSNTYNSSEQVYIDNVHVTPQGHFLLVDELSKHIDLKFNH